jgi:hypothetical protein
MLVDREMLIEKVFTRVRNINGNILYHFTVGECQEDSLSLSSSCTRNYLNIDKAIVGDIIQKYKYLFN